MRVVFSLGGMVWRWCACLCWGGLYVGLMLARAVIVAAAGVRCCWNGVDVVVGTAGIGKDGLACDPCAGFSRCAFGGAVVGVMSMLGTTKKRGLWAGVKEDEEDEEVVAVERGE